MSWLYVPGQECSSEASALLPQRLASCVTWRGKHSPPRTWSTRCKREWWMRLLSGLTCEPSAAAHGVASWISSLRASRASPSARQGRSSEPRTSATPGQTSTGSLAKYDPASCSWRMSQASLLGTDTLYSGTWPRSGSMRNGECFPRPRLARHTSGADSSSLLPTPSATGFGTSQNGQRADGSTFKGAGKPSLETMARRGLLPTPTVGDSKGSGSRNTSQSKAHTGVSLTDWVRQDGGRGRLLPTPTARDYKGRSPRAEAHQGYCLPSALGQTTRCLNPQFTEWMMGWPIGWTDFACVGTELCPSRWPWPSRS